MSRIPTWVSLILAGIGLLVLAIPGVWVYASLTAPTLHPNPAEIPAVTASAPPPQWAAQVERAREIVRASLTQQNLPGISVAVGIDGSIVWAEGFGFANLEDSVPVTPDHRFRIGSASQALTSAGLGLLMEQGKLSLDDEIQNYVPDFTKKQWPVTIRQTMANLGGFRTEDTDNGVFTAPHCDNAGDAVKLFAEDPLVFQPGTQYNDSTFGWVLLSAVIETVARKPVNEFLLESVARPLGMRDTVRESGKDPVPGEATSYVPRAFSNPVYGPKLLPRFDYSCYLGANGFLATPSDLVRFGMGIHSGQLLRPETVQTLQTPQKLVSGEETESGLGWEVRTATLAGEPVRAVGRSGRFWMRTVASLLTFPERGLTVAVTSNISFQDLPALAEKIAGAFAEK